MSRRTDSASKNALSRAGDAIKRTAARVAARIHHEHEEPVVEEKRPRAAHVERAPQQERKRHPQTDIPMDALSNAYTPQQTSLKAPFRANGKERPRDQESGRSIADERWNDEDRLTNKSGDPRIGTHGRTYEPGESRLAKGRR